MQFRSGIHLISHYLWVIIILAFIAIGPIAKVYQYVGTISSADQDKFDRLLDPTIFTHLTDIHLNSFLTERTEHFEMALNQSYNLKSKSIIFTGDIVDNWGGVEDKDFFVYGHQFEPDFKEYQKALNKSYIESIPLLDIPGNHDEYGVRKLKSDHHYFLKYSHVYNNSYENNKTDFWAKTFVLGGNTFVVVNPYEWPTPHAKLGFWVNPGKELLNAIEAEFNKPYATKHRFLLTHFPIKLWSERFKSSSGKNFKQIVKEAKFDMILTGHLHPGEPIIMHHDSQLEVVGTDLLTNQRYGIITDDNGRLSYHMADINKPPQSIVTFPIPKNQINKNVDFNKTGPVRLVSTNGTLSPKVSGLLNEPLILVRQMASGLFLYESASVVNTSGSIKVEDGNGYAETFDVIVGESASLPSERVYFFPELWNTGLAIFGIALIVCAFLVIPFGAAVDSCECCVGTDIGCARAAILGPFIVKKHLANLPTALRIACFLFVVLPLVVPPNIIDIDGGVGGIWPWGYVVDAVFHYDLFATLFGAIYYAGICLPFLLCLSGLASDYGFHCVMIVDAAVGLAGIAAAAWMTLTFSVEATGTTLAFLAPGFVFMPILMLVSVCVYLAVRRRKSILMSTLDNPLV